MHPGQLCWRSQQAGRQMLPLPAPSLLAWGLRVGLSCRAVSVGGAAWSSSTVPVPAAQSQKNSALSVLAWNSCWGNDQIHLMPFVQLLSGLVLRFWLGASLMFSVKQTVLSPRSGTALLHPSSIAQLVLLQFMVLQITVVCQNSLPL